MKKKQEYIEDLERMKESYYNLDGCMSAMNKFKEDINLLTELVNEHFKENIETNFEHYKDGIVDCCINNLAVVKGIPKLCSKTECNDCDFLTIQKGCHEIAKEWLKHTYIKPKYKLTQFEYDLLQSYANGYKFKDVMPLIVMKEKRYFKDVDNDVKIEDILANCEVVG